MKKVDKYVRFSSSEDERLGEMCRVEISKDSGATWEVLGMCKVYLDTTGWPLPNKLINCGLLYTYENLIRAGYTPYV